MTTAPMVRLAVVPTAFEAQLLAARLGSEGLLWQLRGNVGGPYPVGPVEVLVRPDDLAVACELLLVDEVELAFEELDDDPDVGEAPHAERPARVGGRWVRVGVPATLLAGSVLACAAGVVRLLEQGT